MPRSRTCAFALAALLPLITAATPSSTPFVPPAGEDPRQAAYAEAARTYGVPEEILLAVSYLQSRWDTHAGRPSTAGGYGPMHLTAPVELPPRAPDDLRGDGSVPAHAPIPRATTTTTDQIALAARLTGLSPAALRTDPAANIRGGAALLAHHHRRLAPTAPAGDLAGWREAIAAYASPTPGSGASFANEVFATIRTGATRTTDDGHRVRLRPAPVPDPAPFRDSAAECPPEIACDWLPAAHRTYAKGRYGNHDRTLDGRRIDYIVIHDGETTYDAMTRLRRDPKYVSWHYTLRSQDGQVAQHVRTRDIAWHSGNWYVNTHSIGLEHEGYLASGGTWYTEAMYRSSARLVRYLADKYDIPLDRAHILGHDNVPGTTPATVRGMHVDPGPYWDWAHYFTLLGAPLSPSAGYDQAMWPPPSPSSSAMVMILPRFEANRPRYTGCVRNRPRRPCPSQGSSAVWLHSAPDETAPLVRDPGRHPDGAPSTTSVYDHAARASTGQTYAVAGRSGDWTAIWYLGRRAWFHDPAWAPASAPAEGVLATPRPGAGPVPLYGRAYPEPAAYPPGVRPEPLTPLQYRLLPGQHYTVGLTVRSSYYRASSRNPARHRRVTGRLVYHQIQFGHRVMFVRAGDVTLRRTAPQAIHAAKTSSNPPPSASRVRRTPEER